MYVGDTMNKLNNDDDEKQQEAFREECELLTKHLSTLQLRFTQPMQIACRMRRRMAKVRACLRRCSTLAGKRRNSNEHDHLNQTNVRVGVRGSSIERAMRTMWANGGRQTFGIRAACTEHGRGERVYAHVVR
jgi:hypothetical protein